MNKAIRLSAMAAACALFAFLSATEVKADGLLITSDQDQLIRDTEYITNEEIIFTEGTVKQEDILLADDSATSDEEILLAEDTQPKTAINNDLNVSSRSGGGYNEDILLASDDSRTGNNSTEILIDISDNRSSTGSNKKNNNSGSGDIILESTAGNAPTNSGSAVLSDDSKNNNKTDNKNTDVTVTDTMRRMLDAINKRRAKAGVCQLTFRSDLNKVAALRVNEVTKKFSHTRANGKNWVSILTENGVAHEAAGENLACRINDPEQVVSAWAMSPSHNRCMLNGDYAHAGIGTVTVNGCTYWTLTLTD